MDENERVGTGGRGTTAAAVVLALLTVAVLAVAGWLWREGWRHRQAALVRPAPAPQAAPRPAAHRERRAKPARIPSPAPPAAGPAKTPAGEPFQGQPIAFSVGQNQTILYQDRAGEGLAPTFLIVLSPDYEVLGTLFLPRTDPVLPSRFLIKDASWGQGRRFGGQDVLLGIVACPPGTQDGKALRDAVSEDSWWHGKAVPAFQMDF